MLRACTESAADADSMPAASADSADTPEASAWRSFSGRAGVSAECMGGGGALSDASVLDSSRARRSRSSAFLELSAHVLVPDDALVSVAAAVPVVCSDADAGTVAKGHDRAHAHTTAAARARSRK